MVRIAPDVGRNRILIQLLKQVTPDDGAVAERDLVDALQRLRPPVDVLSDIRELEELHEGFSPYFLRLGNALHAFGVRKFVRVVGRSAQAAVQVERMSRLIKHHAHLAFSIDEAEDEFRK